MPSALLLCSIAAILGTLAATPTDPDIRLLSGAGLAALAVAALCGRWPPKLLMLTAIALLASGINAELRRHAVPLVVEARTARYRATVLATTSAGDGSTSVTFALENGLRVLARIRGSEPSIGDGAIVRGRLEPFDQARNSGEPSEREIEHERGFDGRLDGAEVLSLRAHAVSDSTTWLARAHAWAHAQLRDRLGEPNASVVAGELWGERSALSPALHAEFQETGTVHILVTAGLHLGAVAMLCIGLLTILSLPRWIACIAAIALVWGFVWWSGAQLPAVRAATMATAALTARACGRATLSWNALAIGALVVTFARPASVATISFALSFSCVGAIFTCAGPLDRWLETRIELPERVREALILSLATQVGVWPLGGAAFLQFTPYALAANFAIVPCVAATMALGAAQLLLASFGPLAQACANVNSWLLAWMLSVVQTIAALPGAAIPMTPAPAWCIAAYDAALVSAPLLWRRGATTLAIASIVLATAFVLLPPRGTPRGIDHRLRITVLDVGQADAIVIETPHGHALLVDAGGRLEHGSQINGSVAEQIGERIVVPFLLRRGIHALDAIVLSHPHGDHAGGVAPVLRRLRVGEFADGGQRYGGHAYRDAVATARAENVAIVYPRAGAVWGLDGVVLRFLGPSLPLIANSRNDINENSIAFTLRYESFCMLFTGDAGAAAESRFLTGGANLRCDILKVGHHGSAYSSTPAFIAAVRPRYAIISVGRHNMFGHPAPSTIETLRQSGARLYRTDESGSVMILTDGRAATISTML
jgi:competence protein ComEC